MIPSISQIKAVMAVYQEGNFGKAARACFVTQPNLTMQIQKVEKHFDVVLFDRSRKPVTVTDDGRKFIELGRRILEAHAELVSRMKAAAGTVSGELSVAVIPTLGPYLIPLFLRPFSERHPNVNLLVDEMQTETIIARILEGRLDAGILATPLHEPLIAETKLFDEPFHYYSAGTLPKKKLINPADLEPGNIWLLEEGNCLREQVIKFCELKNYGNVIGNVHFAGGSLETLRNLVRAGQGATIFPSLFIDQLPAAEVEDSVRPFAPPVPAREISIVHRSGYWKEPVVQTLGEVIRACVPATLGKPGAGGKGGLQRMEFR